MRMRYTYIKNYKNNKSDLILLQNFVLPFFDFNFAKTFF